MSLIQKIYRLTSRKTELQPKVTKLDPNAELKKEDGLFVQEKPTNKQSTIDRMYKIHSFIPKIVRDKLKKDGYYELSRRNLSAQGIFDSSMNQGNSIYKVLNNLYFNNNAKPVTGNKKLLVDSLDKFKNSKENTEFLIRNSKGYRENIGGENIYNRNFSNMYTAFVNHMLNTHEDKSTYVDHIKSFYNKVKDTHPETGLHFANSIISLINILKGHK